MSETKYVMVEPSQFDLDRPETTVNTVDEHDWDGATPRKIDPEQGA